MAQLSELADIVGASHVLTGDDCAPYTHDWTDAYQSTPMAVVRPANTAEVSRVVKWAAAHDIACIAVGGSTGLTGATQTNGGLLISLARMNAIREIRPAAKLAVVEAGVVLSTLHTAANDQGLTFPLYFGARGSAMVGGVLATNAGGSNVLRYGSTRGLCLGLEIVLPSGEILDLMSELHKDNSGYDLRDLFIGAEGTLGIITAAVVKLVPTPGAYATAMVAMENLPDALELLNNLQRDTGGAVEAFEYMPGDYMRTMAKVLPDMRQPFDDIHPVNILIEVGATAPRDCTPDDTGTAPIAAVLETALEQAFEAGTVIDATVAQNEAQRQLMWDRREAAAELAFHRTPMCNTDVALPLDQVANFLDAVHARIAERDANAGTLVVSHLGDGNVHLTIWPTVTTPDEIAAFTELVEDVVQDHRGSFSAEHGIGLSKKSTMARRKSPAALEVMRAIKSALDPQNIMNPGKVIPPK